MKRVGCALAVLGALTPAARALAQEPARPSEADMFGGGAAASTPATEAAPPGEGSSKSGKTQDQGGTPPAEPASPVVPAGSDRDQQLLSGGATQLSEDVAPEDPLRIGGQFYLRAQSTGQQGRSPQNWSFSSPSLLDAYLDARPNERVRGFVLGRMIYDPTLPSAADAATPAIGTVSPTGSTMGSQSLSSLFARGSRDPRVVLDQFWLRFDVAHTVFVTAGKQHVRWGTARFWTPSDFLHLRPRNPLDVFDARTGTSMLKLHIPVESRGWNFYLYGLTESQGATSRPSDVAGAARAEIVLGTAEVGLGALVQRDRKPKLAADLSTGIGDVDVYGEIALRSGDEIDRVQYDPNATLPAPATCQPWETSSGCVQRQIAAAVDAVFPVVHRTGMRPQAVGGASYSHKYNDNDVWTLGVEYFYNDLGYSNTRAYPGLVLPHSQPLAEAATFFYLGRQYGAVFFTMPAPYSLNYHTFTLSTLGNLSDRSFISRFDYSLLLLTHLRFEAFVSARLGRRAGEFRFGQDFSAFGVPFSTPPAVVDCGLALRISI